MQINVQQGSIQLAEADTIIINLFDDVTTPGGATGAVNQALDGAIADLIASGDLTGKAGEVGVLYPRGAIPATRVLVVGLGKRDEFNLKTKENINERKRLDEDFRLNRERAAEYKKKRDALNEQVKVLKEQRGTLLKTLTKYNNDLKIVKENEDQDRKKQKVTTERDKRYIPLRKIKSQINALEKKIITEILDIKEENDIIEKIRKLEVLKNEAEGKTLMKSTEARKIYKEINTIRGQLKEFNTNIHQLSEDSQNYHVLMLELYRENDIKKKDIDQISRDLAESKIVADEFHNKYTALRIKQKRSRKARQTGTRAGRIARKEIQEATLQDALEKKKQGKKLNIFEARALFESSSK